MALLVSGVSCREPARVEYDLAAGPGGLRAEAAIHVPDDAVLELSGAVIRRDDALGQPVILGVWAHQTEGPALLLHRSEIEAGKVEVAEFADLASLAGRPALIAVSVTGARQVEWRRLRVIGRGAEGERPDRTIRAAEKAPDIVVYVVDALRPDALSAYGGPIPTPAFDSLAQDGARFEPALTTSTWTRPATASLLTGLYPSAHGALDRPHILAESLFTLPERLRLLGYRTVAVVANGNIDRVWGFGQGFETFVLAPYPAQTTPGVPEHPRAGQLHGIALEEWARQGDDRPLFLYIHTVDPHGPYNPPEWLLERPRPDIYERNTEKILAGLNTRQVAPEPGLLTALRDLYLGEVAYADRELGRFLEQIRTPEGGNTLFLLTADHGEARMEHGFASHGMSLHREELEIPLLLWGPGRIPEGRTINQPVSLIDVAPTVLAAAGGAATALPGTDLARLAGGGQVERSLFAELDYDGRRWSALVEGRWALLHQVGRERFLLFDWEADRGETQDLSEAHPQLVEQLATSLEVLRRQVLSSSVAEPALLQGRPDEEVIENLRALGYVE